MERDSREFQGADDGSGGRSGAVPQGGRSPPDEKKRKRSRKQSFLDLPGWDGFPFAEGSLVSALTTTCRLKRRSLWLPVSSEREAMNIYKCGIVAETLPSRQSTHRGVRVGARNLAQSFLLAPSDSPLSLRLIGHQCQFRYFFMCSHKC